MEMCRFHSARPEGLEPVCGQWKSADVRMTILPDGFPEDPEKHKRFAKIAPTVNHSILVSSKFGDLKD